MALFGNKEDKEAKAAAKAQEMLAKYGLTELSDPKDVESVQKVVQELAGSNLIEVGAALGGANEKQLALEQLRYQRVLVEQNFILIRQLDRLLKK